MGDMNGDGYDDFIVGAPGNNSGTGAAYIFYGGPEFDYNMNTSHANVTLVGYSKGDLFGWDVASAGDVNNDGYDDIIIGAPGAGKSYFYYGNGTNLLNYSNKCISPTSIGGGDPLHMGGWTAGAGSFLEGILEDDGTYSFHGALDGGDSVGSKKIEYNLSADGLAPNLTHKIDWIELGINFGYSGDDNMQEVDDMDGSNPAEGVANDPQRIGLYNISSTEVDWLSNLTYLNDNFEHTDIITFQPPFDNYIDNSTGIIEVYFEFNFTLGPTDDAIMAIDYTWIDFYIVNDEADVVLNGSKADKFGFSVSGVGDLNNDGYDDVLIGAPYYDLSDMENWWNEAWACRMKLVFDNTQQMETLNNFPVLVTLNETNFDYSNAKAGGIDIRFIDEDNSTELKYHIEDWNTNGDSYIWVNVSQIDGNSNTDHIWMYYNNPLATDVQDPAGTYESSFRGVWHLNETVIDEIDSGIHYDSTSNNFDGSQNDNDEASGQISQCQNFDQGNDYIEFDNTNTMLPDDNSWTFDLWFRNTGSVDITGNERIFYLSRPGGGSAIIFELEADAPDTLNMVYHDGGGFNQLNVETLANLMNNWHYFAGTYDGITFKTYLNGNLVLQASDTFSGFGNDKAGLGINIALLNQDLGGMVDEVRISNIARSPDWITAQYLSMNNSFVSYGGDEITGWWAAGWSYRKQLTFDNSGQSEHLENFPVLVTLNDTNFNYSNSKAGGVDIRFVDADDSTELKYHIEDWNSSGDSYIWVNVTQIDGNSNADHIWMYYDNPSAGNVQDAFGTYDSNYVGIWHLDEDDTGTRKDIFGNYDGSAMHYDGDEAVAGMIAGADLLDRSSNDYIDIGGDGGALDITGDITVTAWANVTGYAGNHRPIIGKGDTQYMLRADDSNSFVFFTHDGNFRECQANADFNQNSWYYVVGRVEGNEVSIWVDGVKQADTEVGGITSNAYDVEIGRNSKYAGRRFEGSIDEVRISNVARSSDWIKAQYLSMTNNFISFSEEMAPLAKSNTGVVYLYLGGEEMDNFASSGFFGNRSNDFFGFCMEGNMNLNDDEFDDIVICAPGGDVGYAFFGKSNMAVKAMASNANLTIAGSMAESFGKSISSAKDLDSDGLDEVIIGAPGNNSKTGVAYLFKGSYIHSQSQGDRIINLSAGDLANVTFMGSYQGDRFGSMVEGGADTNNDGLPDILISAPSNNTLNQGAVYLFFGDGNMDAVITAENSDFSWFGDVAGDEFGFAIALGGNLDGDSYNNQEIIIATPFFDSVNGANAGKLFVFTLPSEPLFSNVTASPDPQEYGGYVNISADVYDNLKLFGVWVNITDVGNFTMDYHQISDKYYYNASYTDLGTFTYVIWANDTYNAWNSSGEHTFTIEDTTLPSISNVQDEPDPQVYGGFVNFSAAVKDNVNLSGVWIDFSTMGNYSMKYDETSERYFFNESITYQGKHYYTIRANDTSNNWNSSVEFNFTIIDTIAPVLSDVQAVPDPLEFGGSVNISASVVDNVNVSTVWVNLTGIGNYSMNYDPISLKYYLIAPFYIIDTIEFSIWANDTSDNWNGSADHNFSMIDTGLPVISDLSATPDPQEMEGYVNITAIVNDNENISGVWINITGFGNFSMEYDLLSGRYYFNRTYSILGIHEFRIWANDTSNNWNSSPLDSFQIIDSTPPEITQVSASPNPQELGGYVNITALLSDNENISTVWVNITGFGNYSMEYDQLSSSYYFNRTYSILGEHEFRIWANDTSDNWNSSILVTFQIIDTALPEIIQVSAVPDPQEFGGYVNITAIVNDNENISGVWVEINGFGNFTMEYDQLSGRYYFNRTYSILGEHQFVISANDTSDNWNSSLQENFQIIDTTLPLIMQISAAPDPQEYGGHVNITGTIIDNVNISEVWVNIIGIGNYSMVFHPASGSYYFNQSYFQLGNHEFSVLARDSSGNWNDSGPYVFTIRDTINPLVSNLLVSPNPQVAGEPINISIEAVDLVGVSQAWIWIDTPDRVMLNQSMSNSGPSTWFYEAIFTTSGDYTFQISVADGSDNWMSSQESDFTIIPSDPYNVTKVSGDGQTGIVGTELAQMFEIRVTDRYENAVPGARVWYDIVSGGGTLDGSPPLVTDSQGSVMAGYKLGVKAGVNTVSMNITGEGTDTVIFDAFGEPGQLYGLAVIAENNQSSISLKVNSTSVFRINAWDRYYNPISPEGVNWSTDAGLIIGSNETHCTFRADTIPLENGYVRASIGLIQNQSLVNIIPGDLALIVIEPSETVIEVGEEIEFTAEGFDAFNNSLDILVDEWASDIGIIRSFSDTAAVLKVQGNPGEGFITARTGEIIGVSSITVIGKIYPPIINGIVPDIQLIEDQSRHILILSPYEFDFDDPPEDLRWYITDIDESKFSVSGQGSDDDRMIITVVPNAFGDTLTKLWLFDAKGYNVTQELWINITPVNDKPVIADCPDLIVHYDDPLTFDYTPYVSDIETPVDKLNMSVAENQLEEDHVEVNGLKVTYLYPEAMLGESVIITLTVDDGEDFYSDSIIVRITEDYVPELVEDIPDVILYEGETKTNVFNLDDFFIDPDEDDIYYSYGQSMITVKIHENNSVDIASLGDWYGTDTVTFRAEDPIGAIAEDTITITVLPVNDPPVIAGVPDLWVHYDADYYFDLSPYIEDIDNNRTDLYLTFSDALTDDPEYHILIHENTQFIMKLNYPMSMLGETKQVKIMVHDGSDFSYQKINVTVTDDWPPIVRRQLPDVDFDEDTYIENVFSLNYFFHDRDDDLLYYTYGNENILVNISSNSSVNFTAPENWFGSEYVLFRATDPTGALVETGINVTVHPVNDLPEIFNLFDQNHEVGFWTISLGDKLRDVDDPLHTLELTVTSKNENLKILVNGLDITLLADEPLETKLIINVSDGEGQISRELAVTVTPARDDGTSSSANLPLFLLLLLIVLILVLFFFLQSYYGHYKVDNLYLIHKNGILIKNLIRKERTHLDADIISSMFTAVQDFIDDSLSDINDPDKAPIKKLEFGNRNIILERGNDVYLVLIVKGKPGTALQTKMSWVLSQVESDYESLSEWDGDVEKLEGIEDHLRALIKDGHSAEDLILGKDGYLKKEEEEDLGSKVAAVAAVSNRGKDLEMDIDADDDDVIHEWAEAETDDDDIVDDQFDGYSEISSSEIDEDGGDESDVNGALTDNISLDDMLITTDDDAIDIEEADSSVADENDLEKMESDDSGSPEDEFHEEEIDEKVVHDEELNEFDEYDEVETEYAEDADVASYTRDETEPYEEELDDHDDEESEHMESETDDDDSDYSDQYDQDDIEEEIHGTDAEDDFEEDLEGIEQWDNDEEEDVEVWGVGSEEDDDRQEEEESELDDPSENPEENDNTVLDDEHDEHDESVKENEIIFEIIEEGAGDSEDSEESQTTPEENKELEFWN